MASRNFDHPWMLGKKTRLITGSFAPNGSTAGAIAAASIEGKGVASVVRNSAGNFTITLTDPYLKLVAAIPGIQTNSNTDIYPTFGAFSNVGSTTGAAVSFVMRLLTGSTETDLAANANNRVSFWLVFQDSGV